MFKDRQDAGKQLAIAVAEQLNRITVTRPIRTIVVAVSRGGIVVGKEVATTLCAPLTLLVAKHINSPSDPDEPVAAVSSSGLLVISDRFDDSIEGMPSYIRNQQMHLSRISKTLEEHWFGQANYEPPVLAGKRLVVVSDCCITGLTEMAALRTLRMEKPKQMILACPVVSQGARMRLNPDCLAIVSLLTPGIVKGALQHYEMFPHVEDKEVVDILKSANRIGSSAARE